MHHQRPARTTPSRRWGPPLAAVTTTALLGTLLTAAPATATPAPTRGLPGTGSLSALATARPATVERAQEQFLARTPAALRDQELAWAPCTAQEVAPAEVDALLECSRVLVPRDWHDPAAGEPLEIAVSRLSREGDRPARTIVTNPGGPGGAGLSMGVLGLQPALAGTEVIGLDVRGTGASTTLTCGRDALTAMSAAPDVRDRSPEALAAAAAAMAATADACADDPLVDVVTTEQTVHDIDLVRDALDRDTVDWVGYSGGTWLGAQYATYFPGRVGRFVLDSAVDVGSAFQTVFSEDQPMAFQRRFEQDYAPYAAQHAWLYHLGGTPAEVVATYERLRAAYAGAPLGLPGLGLGVDGRIVDTLVVQAMYSKARFEQLSWILLALQVVDRLRSTGDAAAVERAAADLTVRLHALAPQLADPQVPALASMNATFLATTCNDTAWSQGQEFWDALGERQGSRYPLAGWSKTQQPCGYWDRPALKIGRAHV